MEKPKVSIVIPVYNGEKYLKAAIDSALEQTYSNIEIIVVNDGSKDNSEDIALSYGDKIRYFKKDNGGVSTALNLALKKMEGDYFSWLSHDDLYFPNKIEDQIDYLNKCGTIGKNTILYSDYAVIDENSNYIGERVLDTDELNNKPEYSLLTMAINGITLLIPKAAFDDCGNFDENLRCTQDYELWFRMKDKYNFVHIPRMLAKTRVHKNQETNTNPRVITEGNQLWIKMICTLSDDRKEALEGNLFNFYYRMAQILSTTPYIETMKYCIAMLNKLDKTKKLTMKDFIIKPSKRNSTFKMIRKGIVSIKQIGFKRTLQRLKRFRMNSRLYK